MELAESGAHLFAGALADEITGNDEQEMMLSVFGELDLSAEDLSTLINVSMSIMVGCAIALGVQTQRQMEPENET